VLDRQRILIAEDEPLIALDLEAAVIEYDGVVVGPCSSVADGLRLANSEVIHGAILDVRLRDGESLILAEYLSARCIPFVVHSGQGEITIPGDWPKAPVVSKPALPENVISALASLLNA
jgi:DNA-binding NtrC family response regulator